MSGPGVTRGGRAPLFDRLVDPKPNEPVGVQPHPVLDRAGLDQSIQRELERLLNTRSPYPADTFSQEDRTVLDYGLPDYSSMYTRSPEDQARLSGLVRSTIEAYEPRLRNISVDVDLLHDSEKALLIRVSGDLMIGRLTERVAFLVDVAGERAATATNGS